MKLLRNRLALAISLALAGHCAQALENRLVYGSDGQPTFQARFMDVGDGPVMGEEGDILQSTWNLDALQKDKITEALKRWAEIIKPTPGQLPAIINIGTVDDENAFGNSASVPEGQTSLTQLQRALFGMTNPTLTFGSHGQFVMGKMDWDTLPAYMPSQLPRAQSGADLTAVAFHELAHGLGIMGAVSDKLGPGSDTPYFGDALDSWAQHLRDDNGNPARPGQSVYCSGCNNPYTPGSFDAGNDKAYFTGAHVQEVLAGAMPGLPVRIHDEDGDIDSNYMAHIELKNSLMSHQEYRNYTQFMEAELAAMQDMGYDIDRRNFFGYSVYGNGQQLVNPNGYFLRNASGTAYIPGQYNTATLGLGLHIYGSYNTVYQQADLLTKGPGGAGVRVDGAGNTLVVQPGTRIYADGLNGRGVMFAYGKNHNLVLRGDVQALGEQGIGASFDFGNNALGNESEYRGSYIYTIDGVSRAPLAELSGALVDNFDLTGRLAGRAAAIYISDNALVNRINVMRGARIEGNIYSAYNQRDGGGAQRLTHITFGQLADGQGRATGRPDPGFALRYDGNIQGINNLVVDAKGGTTSLNGSHELYGVVVDSGATLGGNSTYTLNSEGSFENRGTVSPGNSIGTITINGNYEQAATGRLLMEVNNRGDHDTLVVNGTAELGGTLTLEPVADWYASGLTLNLSLNELERAGITIGTFAALDSVIASPTLLVTASMPGGDIYRLSITRQNNAYSQYALNDNARRAGRALDAVAGYARPDIQPLYRTLDFSAPDGSAIAGALDQLTPETYSAMAASSLDRERLIAGQISARNLAARRSPAAGGEWRGFATPFGGGARQDASGTLIGRDASIYGVTFGAETFDSRHPAWSWGIYGAVSGQSVDVNDGYSASGRSTAFNLGLQAAYEPDPAAGPYLFGLGQLGIEDAHFTRHLSIDGYTAKNQADWTALNGTLAAGGGYRWALSKALSVGPLATLSYTRLNRPGLTESGDDATRLQLSSTHFDSLRSSIGLGANLNLARPDGALLAANLQVTWDHELLDNDYVQQAAFAGYPQAPFTSRNKLVGRDALGLAAGLSYEVDKKLTVGANVSSQLFRSGYQSVAGSLTLSRRF
jgi:uncharacterized protein YhjY with autotransporter beta-barrel domain